MKLPHHVVALSLSQQWPYQCLAASVTPATVFATFRDVLFFHCFLAHRRFCEADIDTLLARGSRVVQIGDAVDEDGEGETRVSAFNFSKTSFQAADGDGDLDFNDPDFWSKVRCRIVYGCAAVPCCDI